MNATSLTFKTLGKSLGIALAGLILGQSAPVLAQSQAHARFDNGQTGFTRPRSTDDLSRTSRLNGTPGQISRDLIPSCPSGQVLSGGSCVVISNQAASAPSGTMCGSALDVAATSRENYTIIQPSTSCMGRPITEGCPPGYFFTSVFHMLYSSGRNFYSCVKS